MSSLKLRIRSSKTKETIRIDISNSSSFLDLKTLISSNLSSAKPIPLESIHLSLNQTDEIASSPEVPIHTLGLISGDLMYYSIDSNPNSPSETLNPSSVPLVETLVSLSQAPEQLTDDMEVESESDPYVLGKVVSVPCLLRRVMEAEKGKIKGDLGLLVAAIHAVLLESGFVACTDGGGSSLPNGCSLAGGLVSVMYTLPDLLGCSNLEDIKNVLLKFSTVGNHISVYGFVVGALPDVHRLSLVSSKLTPLLISAVNELSGKEQEDVFQFWKTVKDRLSVPLLIDICQKNGLDLPPCFIRLPTDLKFMIVEFLQGIDLAKAACTCSELRYLVSNDELWRWKVLEEFNMLVVESTGGSWKSKFAKLWVKCKKPRTERDNALISYIQSPRITRVPHVPISQRLPMIGGDYDHFPAIGNFGSFQRTRFSQHPARRNFSPNCNLGGDSMTFKLSIHKQASKTNKTDNVLLERPESSYENGLNYLLWEPMWINKLLKMMDNMSTFKNSGITTEHVIRQVKSQRWRWDII